jgi:hypothetical protein
MQFFLESWCVLRLYGILCEFSLNLIYDLVISFLNEYNIQLDVLFQVANFFLVENYVIPSPQEIYPLHLES